MEPVTKPLFFIVLWAPEVAPNLSPADPVHNPTQNNSSSPVPATRQLLNTSILLMANGAKKHLDPCSSSVISTTCSKVPAFTQIYYGVGSFQLNGALANEDPKYPLSTNNGLSLM